MSKRILLFFFGLAAFLGCDDNQSGNVFINDCGYCPNNTSCLGDECGCPDENTFDMGSWCLRKEENLFVAEILGCPCFETFGLLFLNMEPVDPGQGGVIISGSLFSMATRENPYTGFQSNGLLVYDRPDGDSIVLYGMPLPKQGYPTFCQVEPNKRCWANLYGKFQGPDTIRATIRWKNCSDNNGDYTTYDEVYPVLLTRWE
ncbi:MAG: hypothetical protein IT270_10560 [Saprospiraceae bacterium]|nr:hypothetical protein [Saprospiraceae bacterium]